ncbi:hypothetical protein QUF74_07140 [Candidatus Halobeggiatoa sp. HSG11]|nr:hypothetical protein [Candidatus Halobeggiatoa sp. HSG11]
MFKTFLNTVFLFALLLFNTALFTWCVNQLELDKPESKKVLITSVQAKSYFKPIAKRVITQRPIRPSKYVTPSDHKGQPIGRLHLQFQSISTKFESKENSKLSNMLNELNIGADHSVLIFSGAAKSADNIPAPQISKLRVQTVARVIYPYTQTVKMFYRPSIKEGTVIIEFFEPSK